MDKCSTLNRAQLESIRLLGKSANRDLVAEFSGILIADFPRRQALMQRALEGHNGKALELEAHSLCNICAYLGAERMIALCQRIERCGGDGTLTRANEMLGELSDEHVRFLSALAAYQEELGAGPRNS